MAKSENILILSDIHAPFQSFDLFPFLKALKKKYSFDRIISVGDEVSWEAMSYHDKGGDMPSAGDELQSSREVMRELYQLFPIMDIVESNHGSLVFRKGVTHGFPKHAITSYADMLFGERDKWGNLYRPHTLGVGWKWHPKLILDLGGGHKCLIVHGDGSPANSLNAAKQAGMSIIFGHHHSRFDIQYHGTSEFLHWGMAVGCLINFHSPAFDYGRKRILSRPIIGCGGIIGGQPRLFPMVLNDKGHWIGVVP